MIKEAIILAGGLGTRLAASLNDLPKCLAPVNGKPFLHYVIAHFKNEGIQKFIFALGHKSEHISEYINNEYPDLNAEFSIEDKPLGTGGAIKKASSLVKEKTVLVINGDTLFSININKLINFHDMCGADCTISLKEMQNIKRFGSIELSKDYSIHSFKEKQECESGLINGGVYALHPANFIKEDLPEIFSFEKDYLEKYYIKRKMYGVVQDKYFIDIGTPQDYARAENEFTEN
jgi:D-glycero-alpha-D-manno-heptose 1-phosphate guanylyltransferase